MTRSRKWAIAVATATLLSPAACADSSKPVVCTSFAQVQQSVNNLSNANLSENGLSALSADLKQVGADLRTLRTDAGTQFQPEIAQLKTAVDQVSASLTTAKGHPSAASFTAVGAAVTAAGDAAKGLKNALSTTC